MKRYTVVWAPEAVAYLAQVWGNLVSQRAAITAAADAIDRILGDDPEKGLELHEGLRTLDIAPLHVLFEIQEQDRKVRVAMVRLNPADGSTHERNGEGIA